MSYKPSLAFAPAGIDACAYWRMWLPHLNMPGSTFQFSQGLPPMNEISECDVMMVQRAMMEGNEKMLNIARTHGIKIIYDLDDNLWAPPKFNPAFAKLKTAEAIKGLLTCARWADVLTVSTSELASVVLNELGHLKNLASNKDIPIVVVGNYVDLKLFEPPLWERDPDKVVIGWGGSNTHLGDIDEVWNMLPDIVLKYPNVYLETVGHDPPKQLIGHERVRVREWCHISEFAKRYATWNWDIVLAPLDKHRFNRSKSCIKMQEAGAIGKPCLAQDINPYRFFCADMPDLKWLLCDSLQWKKKLCELIENKQLRLELGKMMRENVEENFTIEKAVPQWEQICWDAYSI